jgi:hypothetical protein
MALHTLKKFIFIKARIRIRSQVSGSGSDQKGPDSTRSATRVPHHPVLEMFRMLVDELPTWVYFPDKERAEWLNNIIKQLWPNVNTYVR